MRATLHLMAFSAVGLAAVMAVYFIGDAAGLSDLWIAVIEVALRDATGGWEAAIFLDAGLIGVAVLMFVLVREGGAAGARLCHAPARRAGVVST